MVKALTNEEFISRACGVHNNYYKYKNINYVNNNIKIPIVCPLHSTFWQAPGHHLDGRGCPRCGFNKIRAHHTKNTEYFIMRSKKLHGDNVFDYSMAHYINAETPIILICRLHGEFRVRPMDHLRKKNKRCKFLSGCQSCFQERQSKTMRKRMLKNLEIFIKEATIIHNNKYDYSKSEYVDTLTKMNIICPMHGVFAQTPNCHLAGHGCQKCAKYISKQSIAWLDALNIPNDKDHREVLIKIGNRRFFADGFDPTTNTVYEFLGDYWHGDPKRFKARAKNKVAKKTFGRLYKEWKEKKKLLRKAGYRVISIWERDWQKLLKRK